MPGRFLAILILITPTILFAGLPMPQDDVRKQPIATGNSEVAKLLQAWWNDGTAAGNVGDRYDNRDGEHSPLDLKPYPQLTKIQYTPEEFKQRVNWAAQRRLHPFVVFGNSSTSAPPREGGSNPRQYYTNPKGLSFLASQYEHNNLYIYPEHRDHDPGRNGLGPGDGGFGDLYPTNTPYLIISQGSSGTDQPFMRAMPYVLAAFRPEVKAKLIDKGMLMPTIQMIFRSSNKHLKPGDYLTAKAHPTVFEGAWVDPVKMVHMAHDITLATVPPLVRMKVVEEDQPKSGIDFFDPHGNEILGTTPEVIARVFRGKDRWRRMVVSAEESVDLNKKPLTFEWKLFRGDPDAVKIVPKNDAKSIVEIHVAHPTRRPIAPGSPMESSRVEIGVFAHNGQAYSAPGFITWQGLENESRVYDRDDRIAEIDYNAGDTRITVKNWPKLLDSKLANWFPPLTKEQAETTLRLAKDHLDFTEKNPLPTADAAEQSRKDYEKAKREFDEKQRKAYVAAFASHQKALSELAKSKLTKNPDYQRAEKDATEDDRNLFHANLLRKQGWFAAPMLGVDSRDRYLGGLDEARGDYEEMLNAERLAKFVFPGIIAVEQIPNYVDSRLTIPRKWRDVYLYDAKQNFVGWVRTEPGRDPAFFTADGLLIRDRDELGRCKTAAGVNFVVDRPKNAPNTLLLTWTPAPNIVEYEYAGPDDRRGRIKK